MKIEVKNKENQRLSMANEQLQFRLQSHPNLSSNPDTSLNSSSYISFSEENRDQPGSMQQQQQQQQNQQPRHTRAFTLHTSASNGDSITNTIKDASSGGQTGTQPPPVKLRSKSFKNPTMSNKTSEASTNSMNQSLFSTLNYASSSQFRPVSESFNFNLNDQNINMTKSFNVMYDKHNNSSSSNENQFNYFDGLAGDLERNEEDCINSTGCDANDECGSGSTSSLKSANLLNANYRISPDQMTKSVPCMVLKNTTNNANSELQEEYSDEDSYSKLSDLECSSNQS